MRLRVKDMDVATGGTIVGILNKRDAELMDLHHEDRIRIKHGRREIVAILDIAESERAVAPGHIGLMEEALDAIGAKHNAAVEVVLEKKPTSVGFIRKKIEGGKLSAKEINAIVADIVHNRLSSVEMTYFVAGCYCNKLDHNEAVFLTEAMVRNGSQLSFGSRVVADKHCVGGVPGNRTTMVVVPIVAACGVLMPKTSSRSITSPAGTADTMEVLADVAIRSARVKRIVERTNACIIWGGAFDLAAADDKLIKLRHPLSLDPEGMVLASVLAKKKAVGATHVLIDIPFGRGAKIESRKTALRYKGEFEQLGKLLGMKLKVILTDGSEPIGNGVGPALEARDVLMVLRNDAGQPLDLREKSLQMAGVLLELVGKGGRKLAEEVLENGAAYAKMKEIIKAQSGKIWDPAKIRLGRYCFDVLAKQSGKVNHIDNFLIARVARAAGAPLDKAAGLFLHKHKGESVERGDRLYTIYAENKEKLGFARAIVQQGYGYELRD
ncbi:MAG: AMP phosphorylase [Candidatus Woesearchaeota archaeon]